MADRTATADNGYEPLSAERDKLLEAMPPSKRKSGAQLHWKPHVNVRCRSAGPLHGKSAKPNKHCNKRNAMTQRA
jgi:hypothetical protein